jgi:hypothetical protein
MDQTIHCPKCGCQFELSALMRVQLEGEIRSDLQAEFERRRETAEAAARVTLEHKDQELEAARLRVNEALEREALILKRERELETRQREAQRDFERRVKEETRRIREEESKAAQERFAGEAAELVRAKDVELADAHAKLGEASSREADLLKRSRELDDRQRQLASEMEQRITAEAVRIRAEEAKAAEVRFARQADDRVRAKEVELEEAHKKLGDVATREAELMKRVRELDEKGREQGVEFERRISEEATRIRTQEAELAERRIQNDREQQRLRDEEARLKEQGLRATIEDLQRKLLQGSQQTQGEAQEVVLRELLVDAFRADTVEDVPKGVRGADITQRVVSPEGRGCGTVLWESKRAKAWGSDWLAKARDDQREAGAACAVVVSQVLPPNVRHFGLVEGVWVCAWPYAVALGSALRLGLVEVASARQSEQGRGEKMQMLFDYLTGTEFRLRVEGIVEAFRDLQDDLETERRAMQTRWNKRAKLMQRARVNISAFWGDMQGIAGRQLEDLPTMALALPEHADDEEDDGEPAGAERPEDARLKALLFDLLPEDGANAGNGSLTDRFVERAAVELGLQVSADDYARCKAALLEEGRIRRGKGKGGSVCRTTAGLA